MGRRIITGEDVRSLPERSLLDLPEDALVTDAAREWLAKKKIQIVAQRPKQEAQPARKARIALGADHGGYQMKEWIKQELAEQGASFFDYGTHSSDAVDYPIFAHAVALGVALGHAELGVVVDGAGIGSAMTANKVPGIRAAACYDEATARNSREHNDANVLTLGAKLTSKESMLRILRTFLLSTISEERHRARVRLIMNIERKYYRGV